jgi:hypothetical protein
MMRLARAKSGLIGLEMPIAKHGRKKPKILAIRAAKFPHIVHIRSDFCFVLRAISTGEKTRRNIEATCNGTPCVVDMVIDDWTLCPRFFMFGGM